MQWGAPIGARRGYAIGRDSASAIMLGDDDGGSVSAKCLIWIKLNHLNKREPDYRISRRMNQSFGSRFGALLRTANRLIL